MKKGRLQPGRMFLVDTAQGRIVDDEELKAALAAEHPYEEWCERGLVHLGDLPDREHVVYSHQSVVRRQETFGYTHEELKLLVAPMARLGGEALGSMGTDTPVAVLSDRSRMLFDYFQQLFAQVTNPPLDAIREELVTSLASTIGPEGNLLDSEPSSCHQSALPFPIIDNDDLAKLIPHQRRRRAPRVRRPRHLRALPRRGRRHRAARGLDRVRAEASAAIADGIGIIVLSDRDSDPELAPIPSLLLVSAVHHHLIREQTRTRVGLVVESGDARGAPHGTAHRVRRRRHQPVPRVRVGRRPHRAAALRARRPRSAEGDQELHQGRRQGRAEGDVEDGHLHRRVVPRGAGVRGDRPWATTSSTSTSPAPCRVSVASGSTRSPRKWRAATGARTRTRPDELAHRDLDLGGEYQWRREGEYHLFNPETVFKLQHATRAKRYDVYKEYTRLVDDQSKRLATLRGLFTFREGARPPVPIDEVEPASEILKRFATGAMSYGSISKEAHENLAIAMNRLGGKSNTGEGGEDADRYVTDANGDERRSAIHQVASGRFGVTSEYLVNADDLQIKMAQGAKPGEGGAAPRPQGVPVDRQDAVLDAGRRAHQSPPHHDIYSIEDIKQLIHDLKNSNPSARAREARRRGRRRHGRGRRRQGAQRRRADLRPRRRYRRGTAHVDQARGRAVGARAWPRRSRPSCATGCATGSSCRSTGSSRPGATS